MYTYYQRIERETHYPTAKEIAVALGLYVDKEKPASRLIYKLLNISNKRKGHTPIYYHGVKGMTQVFDDLEGIINLITYIKDSIGKRTEGQMAFKIEAEKNTPKFFVDIKQFLSFYKEIKK